MVKLRRLIALYLDCIVIFFIPYVILITLQGILYSSFNFYVPFDIMSEEFSIISIFIDIFITIIFFVIFIILFIRKDTLIGNESIGKKLMFLKIYGKDGKRVTNNKILCDRVFYSIGIGKIIFYPLMILINNQSSGDKKMGTEVY